MGDNREAKFGGRRILGYINEKIGLMIDKRRRDGKWIDIEEDEVGLLKTLEALSAVLSVGGQKEEIERVWPEFKPRVLEEDMLEEDIKGVLDEVEQYGYAPIPYFTIKRGIGKGQSPFKEYEKGKTDFVDSASFVLTTMVDVKSYYKNIYGKKIPKDLSDRVGREMRSAFEWLVSNAVDKEGKVYWLWGNREVLEEAAKSGNVDFYRTPYVYFTWSAVVALAYYGLSEYASAEDRERVRGILEGVVKWFDEILVYSEEEGRYVVNYSGMYDVDNDFRDANLIFIMNALEWIYSFRSKLMRSEGKTLSQIKLGEDMTSIFVRALLPLYDFLERSTFITLRGGKHDIALPNSLVREDFRKSAIEYEDRACEVLLITALAWAYSVVSYKQFDNAVEEVEKLKGVKEEKLKEFIGSLYRERILDNEFMGEKKLGGGLWPRDGYSIYYTQRVIESLFSIVKYIGLSEDVEFAGKYSELAVGSIEVLQRVLDKAEESFKKEAEGILNTFIEAFLEKLEMIIKDAFKNKSIPLAPEDLSKDFIEKFEEIIKKEIEHELTNRMSKSE